MVVCTNRLDPFGLELGQILVSHHAPTRLNLGDNRIRYRARIKGVSPFTLDQS